MTICNLDGVNPLDRNSWRTSVRRCQVLPTPESGTTAAPQYLVELCQPVASVASRQHLRSTVQQLLVVPRHQLSFYGRRAFCVAGPSVWNSLPDNLRNPIIGGNSFRRSLKTFLFATYWCIQRIRGFTSMRYINRLFTYLHKYQNRIWLQRVTPCPCLAGLVDIHRCVHELSCRQTDRQTDTHVDDPCTSSARTQRRAGNYSETSLTIVECSLDTFKHLNVCTTTKYAFRFQTCNSNDRPV